MTKTDLTAYSIVTGQGTKALRQCSTSFLDNSICTLLSNKTEGLAIEPHQQAIGISQEEPC